MSIIATEEEITHYTAKCFEKSTGYKRVKFAFCKITYPTLPASIDYTRKVLCTAISRSEKMRVNDPRVKKLQDYIDNRKAVNVQHLIAVCERSPVRLGYTPFLYDVTTVEDPSSLRDIKEMYLKEDEVVVRAKTESYDIIDAISASDVVGEYKQLYDRISGGDGNKVVKEQEEKGYYRELVCWFKGVKLNVKEFNKLMDEKDPVTDRPLYNSESFNFTDMATGAHYDGEFTVETAYEHGKENEATYTFRSFKA